MKKIVICDIDGVLNNPKDIVHLYHEEKYTEFTKECVKLPLDIAMANLILDLSKLYDVVFITGRSCKFRKETIKFLKTFICSSSFHLVMRGIGENIPSKLIKSQWIQTNTSEGEVAFAIEDRFDISQWYNHIGINCMIVNKDYFNKDT